MFETYFFLYMAKAQLIVQKKKKKKRKKKENRKNCQKINIKILFLFAIFLTVMAKQFHFQAWLFGYFCIASLIKRGVRDRATYMYVTQNQFQC